MNDYNKDYFWTSVDSGTGIKRYYFRINGMMVEVPKEVYNVCFNSYVKTLRDNRRNKKNGLMSLNVENLENHEYIDLVSDPCDLEKEVINKLMLQRLFFELSSLDDEEKQIVYDLLIEDKSIRILSKEMNIPVMTLQDRKKRILQKLKDKTLK